MPVCKENMPFILFMRENTIGHKIANKDDFMMSIGSFDGSTYASFLVAYLELDSRLMRI